MTLTTRMLVEDFIGANFPRGTQLIDGEVVMNDPTHLHQHSVARILFALMTFTEVDRERGEPGLGGNWRFGPTTSLIPDVWWLRRDRVKLLGDLLHEIAPNIAIEVRSPSTWHYDTGAKLRHYEAAGVDEVWLVDTVSRSIIVQRRLDSGDSSFNDSFEIGQGCLTSPLLPGFELDVAGVFPIDERS
jgi:Uma2 family endonuclease